MRPYVNEKGYLVVILSGKNGTHMKVHRAVAQAFIPNPGGKPQVNHKNGNKKDNTVGNLEWVTSKENAQHAIKTGLR